MAEPLKIALLIDCENASYHSLDGVIQELSKHGELIAQHAHADWSQPSLLNWSNYLQTKPIRLIHNCAHIKGKNTNDIAITIDAMSLLYDKNINLFAIMSSDCDFRPLVLHLIESGKIVYGFGEKKTPLTLVKSYSNFFFTESLLNEDSLLEVPKLLCDKNFTTINRPLIELLTHAVQKFEEHEGWANVSKISNYLKDFCNFSPKEHGYKKLSSLIKATRAFEIRLGTTITKTSD